MVALLSIKFARAFLPEREAEKPAVRKLGPRSRDVPFEMVETRHATQAIVTIVYQSELPGAVETYTLDLI